ncbi:MAG: hypothetical protein P1P88_20660 [Bacteroidales bacterium]|nr:hypothetical protein [Bacteroidales bacterium]
MSNKKADILSIYEQKAGLKQLVFRNTYQTFLQLKGVLLELTNEYNAQLKDKDRKLWLKFKDRGRFQASFKFGGDLLLFSMHSNVFEFDRAHSIWKTSYLQKNRQGAFCGIINIYNFLSDSFKYERETDLGYLVGRIFINKDFHYFVEGKRQMGAIYKNFGDSQIDDASLRTILESALQYVLEFDLLVPPYDNVKITSVEIVQERNNKMIQQTGKRLGYKFNTDDVLGEDAFYTGG